VAKIYPDGVSDEDIAQNKCRRVEVFKMPSGTDYVIHDIDEKNIIVGKARFSGHVRVSEGISVIGLDAEDKGSESERGEIESISPTIVPPTFHPPSFGVTVLGNSHGFDKSGSTSGYVLWINGRGIMIDPPPYSSATLEREGIRPRTIVGIILTHCHADHDAGAFQKVLTGSPVVVITTPTIYKSFIRKYAALSSLSPALLRHCHRYKPAIIGEPLRFQGATFYFTYTLHSIPCVGFRVEWRGRSMVFTGDHFNKPEALSELVEKGVLSKAREADLNYLPIQETDLLLHESGAPPIHTPLEVLLKLPQEVKNRLYVVHTSALPEGCELRAAPTGTAGTIRLDRISRSTDKSSQENRPDILDSFSQEGGFSIKEGQLTEDISEYAEAELFTPATHNYSHLLGEGAVEKKPSKTPPVSFRPPSSSDTWFILNLLSAVPFLSSMSYSSTMEVLETAQVVEYCCGDIVISTKKRSNYLAVVWEGTCMERDESGRRGSQEETASIGDERDVRRGKLAVWHAGDWTGPRILQPEKRLSGDSPTSTTHDIVAMSAEGVKVIMVDFASLHRILISGSALYQKYHLSLSQTHSCTIPETIQGRMLDVFELAVKNLNITELLDSNTGLRKLTAVQKRHLECLVEGPSVYAPGQRLWKSGSPVDKAFIVVAGTVSFVPKRRHGGSSAGTMKSMTRIKRETSTVSSTKICVLNIHSPFSVSHTS
jgi:phosphoribosyl 1,2-cyclic phosphodiesterase